jgi:hypothetical protein
MRRNIAIAAAALVLCIGSSSLSFGAETTAPGTPGTPATGNTGSTHNSNSNPAAKETGMERRGADVGTDTSTHNPTGKKD